MDDKDRENHLAEVRIRRLKDDINQQSLRPPFAEQLPRSNCRSSYAAGDLLSTPPCGNIGSKGQAALGNASAAERWLGQFIYSLLTKRLLSCPFAFARTWWRHLEDEAETDEPPACSTWPVCRRNGPRSRPRATTRRSVLEEDAARYSGAWFRSHGRNRRRPSARVNKALEALGYDRRTVEDPRQARRRWPRSPTQRPKPWSPGSRRTCSSTASCGTTSA